MKEKLKQFMVGRYGVDQLGLAIFTTTFISAILCLFTRSIILTAFTIALLVLFYYRSLSKNLYKRQQENFKFIRFYTPLQKQLNIYKKRFKERKVYKYFKCTHCHQTLRVPRGKGNICITCPKCKQELHKHS